MTITILLADDQALLRATFRLLLDSVPDIEVVGEAGTGEEAVVRARATRPDVVLMDIRMPEVDGIEATRRITTDETLTGVRVLVLTTFETNDLVVAALRAGASGFLGKGVTPEALVGAVRTVAAGESLLSPAATTALIAQVLREPEARPVRDPAAVAAAPAATAAALAELTPREAEITALVGAGLSNQEIAKRLSISPATAKTHVNRAMMKTGSRDRAQMVIFAYESRLVPRPAASQQPHEHVT
jgi:DNA-binding NarL/FixJ family response regulator